MIFLPKRRKPERPHVPRVLQRVFNRHRRYIRSLECSVKNCACQYRIGIWENPEHRRIECAHVRTGTDGGTGLKPSDWWTIPLCAVRHREQHNVGEGTFERVYGLDMKAIALALARKSPDTAMREAMKEAGL